MVVANPSLSATFPSASSLAKTIEPRSSLSFVFLKFFWNLSLIIGATANGLFFMLEGHPLGCSGCLGAELVVEILLLLGQGGFGVRSELLLLFFGQHAVWSIALKDFEIF